MLRMRDKANNLDSIFSTMDFSLSPRITDHGCYEIKYIFVGEVSQDRPLLPPPAPHLPMKNYTGR